MFNVGRELFFVPVIMVLKCLTSRSDAYIYEQLCAGTDPEDHYYRGCLKNMLGEPQEEGLYAPEQMREYIGRSFRDRVKYVVPEWYDNQDICNYLVRKSILVHLEDNEDKFNLVVFMVKKLFQLVQDKCVAEGT
jgi:DNA-directed RNA polymerase I subunit RPA2